jgi:hypothetical protein
MALGATPRKKIVYHVWKTTGVFVGCGGIDWKPVGNCKFLEKTLSFTFKRWYDRLDWF